ncbi:hypothetical protein [Chitinophaga sp. Ak27]|uniref:hypothetical protein n=1 Tax=Chitinophaga sp. Ak27 TaxID=2726116 RepID=UPI00145E7ABA|nr:hypothetical protein [Chitinophaga sp. Ak27]NLU95757.1 glycosyltransferase family 39 protein [Chitinophaga sp. Ak27]
MASTDNMHTEVSNREEIHSTNTHQGHTDKEEPGDGLKKRIKIVASDPVSFKEYLFNSTFNKWLVGIGIFAIIIQFSIFKFFYPYAGFINGDSYVYLETAYHNFPVNTYPIGYSKFLRLISVFTRSDIAIVALQYLLLQLSTISLMFTTFYFYAPLKATKIILYGFMLFNPVYLYLSNYISSDAFFLSLSLIWFTLLLWIINKPSALLIYSSALILFIAFTVRYNALFYPIIGIVALLLGKRRILANIIGFGISISLIGLFMQVTSNKYKDITGYKQFTPFSGWQMANNALYAYRYVDSRHVKPVTPKFKQLDKMVRNYFDSSRNIALHPQEALMANTFYMWAPNSPLSLYMEEQFKKDSTASALKKWATVGPIMSDYGSFLIKTYPTEFVKFYLIPNAVKYYAPPVEFLDHYSTGIDSVTEIAKVWFDYKSLKLKTRVKDYNVNVLNYYPILTGSMNVLFILSLLSFIFLKGYKKYKLLKRGLILVIALWTLNFAFSVFASPIALRFQLFPIIISIMFTSLLMEYLIITAFNKEIDAPIET